MAVKAIGIGFCAIGSAIGAAYGLWQTTGVQEPAWVPLGTISAITGLGCFAIGAIILLLHHGGRTAKEMGEKFFGHWTFDCREALERDADYIDELSTRKIGPATSDVGAIRRLIELRAKLVYLVYRYRRSGRARVEEPRGYFILFPLSPDGERKLREGTFNGANPDTGDLVGRSGCTAVYIGGVAAETGGCGIRCMSLLMGHLRASDFDRTDRVFARAGTSKGLKMLERREFVPLVPERKGIGQVYTRQARYDA